MQSAFDFLKARSINDTLRVNSFEEKLGLKFPPVFRIYLETFVLGKDAIRTEKFYNKKNNAVTLGSPLLNGVEDNGKIYLNSLMSLDEISAEWNGAKADREWTEHELLRIGLLGQAGFGGVYVGCGSHNYEEIWRFNADSLRPFTKLDKHIFDFIKRLDFSYDFSNLERSEYSKLTKNWGDEHWHLGPVIFAKFQL